MGVVGVEAVAMKPSGTRVTASLWLIQQEAMSPRPSKSTPPTSPSVVLPNSAMPVRPTSPPRACAIACMP